MSGEDIRFMTDEQYRKIDLERAEREGSIAGLSGKSLQRFMDIKLAFSETCCAVRRLIRLFEEEK